MNLCSSTYYDFSSCMILAVSMPYDLYCKAAVYGCFDENQDNATLLSN
jgi:hypothetical protein